MQATIKVRVGSSVGWSSIQPNQQPRTQRRLRLTYTPSHRTPCASPAGSWTCWRRATPSPSYRSVGYGACRAVPALYTYTTPPQRCRHHPPIQHQPNTNHITGVCQGAHHGAGGPRAALLRHGRAHRADQEARGQAVRDLRGLARGAEDDEQQQQTRGGERWKSEWGGVGGRVVVVTIVAISGVDHAEGEGRWESRRCMICTIV